MAFPSLEAALNKVSNRYLLVVLAAKRRAAQPRRRAARRDAGTRSRPAARSRRSPRPRSSTASRKTDDAAKAGARHDGARRPRADPRGHRVDRRLQGGVPAARADAARRRVTVCLTEHAREFVGPLTFRTLSGRPVLTDLFDPQSAEAVEHVALAERADAVVVAPATANLLAKARARARRRFPHHAAARRARPGADGPGHGRRHVGAPGRRRQRRHAARPRRHRAGARTRAPSPPVSAARGGCPRSRTIVEAPGRLLHRAGTSPASACSSPPAPPASRSIPCATSPTARPARWATLAAQALRRGAAVTLVSGPTALTPPPGAVFVPVQTAEEMREAVLHHLAGGDDRHQGGRGRRLPGQAPRPPEDQGQARPHARAHAEPDILAEVAARAAPAPSSSASPPRPTTSPPTPAPSSRQGHRPPGGQRREPARHRLRRRRQRGALLDRWGGERAAAPDAQDRGGRRHPQRDVLALRAAPSAAQDA